MLKIGRYVYSQGISPMFNRVGEKGELNLLPGWVSVLKIKNSFNDQTYTDGNRVKSNRNNKRLDYYSKHRDGRSRKR
jgi:hypothetical protein